MRNETDIKAFCNVVAGSLEQPIPFPNLKLADLSGEGQERVGAHVIAMLNERDRRGLGARDDLVYLAALEHFGIACPHTRRVTRDYYPPGAWDCEICGTAFVPLGEVG